MIALTLHGFATAAGVMLAAICIGAWAVITIYTAYRP